MTKHELLTDMWTMFALLSSVCGSAAFLGGDFQSGVIFTVFWMGATVLALIFLTAAVYGAPVVCFRRRTGPEPTDLVLPLPVRLEGGMSPWGPALFAVCNLPAGPTATRSFVCLHPDPGRLAVALAWMISVREADRGQMVNVDVDSMLATMSTGTVPPTSWS